jgi:CRISPR/Cas system-associated exonuclease Cas4 (RecB family)
VASSSGDPAAAPCGEAPAAPDSRFIIRPSQLQMADRCGLAPRLAALHPQSSLPAERGAALHAEIADWLNEGKRPTSREVFALIEHLGSTLRAGRYRGEVPVELRDPETDELVTRGTADAIASGKDLTVVLDFKSGAEERVEPVESNLQLHAYALGVALVQGSREYRTGLVFLREQAPLVRVSRAYLPHEWWSVLDRIKAAVKRPPVPTVGTHCNDCYQRRRCPAWILPAHAGPSVLEPFTRPAGLTPQNAARALQIVTAMKDVVTIAEAHLRDYAREVGGIVEGDRVWAPQVRTRKTADVAALEQDGLGAYVRQSEPYEVYRWRRR